MKALRRVSIEKHRSVLTLFLTLALLIVQIAGLHFHVHQSGTSQASENVHTEHSETHAACHENGCGADVSVTEFWKNSDQGWNALALLTFAFTLLLRAVTRGIGRALAGGVPPYLQPVFLRPPLRAPPI